MMQQAHLTAWQEHAPWPKRSQIEQDLRLSRGVAALFKDAVLRKHLAMRGSTVLHKGHLAPAARYSEDIDLVLTKPIATETLEKHLVRVLSPTLGTPAPSIFLDAWLALRNVRQRSKILSIKFKYVPLGLGRNETINEMLGTKMRALMQRKQGRDLFDLWHAWDRSQARATPYAVNSKWRSRPSSGICQTKGPRWVKRRPVNFFPFDCETRAFATTCKRCFGLACRSSMSTPAL